MARSRDDNKRKAVMDSAVFLFSSKGYAATSIQDIVAHSGFSVGTVYNYFANKEELLTSLIEEGWEEFFQDLRKDIISRKGVGSFEYLYNILFDTVLENIDLASLLINEPLLYPKLEKIAGDLLDFFQKNPDMLPENVSRAMGYKYDKSLFYAAAMGTIQAIKLAKRGFIDIDARQLKMSIGRIFLNSTLPE